ncbi:hypothetical protein KKB41_03715 [Patescibacteria group bacterium]|nr:hypothetical protein [Patescibacteria group bacterium]
MQPVTMAIKGNVPIIFTVPHDGGVVSFFNEEELPIRRPERQNDEGTGYAVYQACDDMERRFKKRPFALFQKVERKRLTREIILSFYNRVLEDVRFCLNKWGRCYLFDFHAFQNQPEIGNYDIVLGTNHRQTTCINFDLQFGNNLGLWVLFDNNKQRCRLKVYVPDMSPREGERFVASKDFTLAKWMKDREPRVNALQMEIYKDWLMMDENTEIFIKVLSNAIALNTL